MTNRIANSLGITALFLSIVLAVTPVRGADDPSEPTIQVSATGIAQLAPDMAILNLSIVREAVTARKALDANNEAMGSVIDALSGTGIKKRDLQTSGFSIQPKYKSIVSSSNNNRSRQIVGYSVSNSLSVRIRDLKQLGPTLDMTVTLGVNSGGNVRFTNDDPTEAITSARTRAMKNAIAKAKTLAAAAGVELGDILSISENSNDQGPVRVARARASFNAAANGVVPLAGGENSYSVTIHASWKISQ